MKIDPLAAHGGINPLLAADPRRRARWSEITDPADLRRSMNGVSRIDEDALNEKRLILEALLDNQLRASFSETRGARGSLFGASPEVASQLFESYAGELKRLDEADTMGYAADASALTNATAGTETFRWTTASLGVIRRMFPKLIAPDLVSVQPMSQPTGKAFYLYHEYADANAIGTLAQYDDTARYTDLGVNDATMGFDLWDDADMAKYAGRTAADNTDNGANIEGSTPRELKLRLNSTDISANSKKLASEWSVELEQDLQAYHGLSAQNEVLNALAGEMAREIDRDIINGLHTEVTGDNTPNTMLVNWAQNGGYTGGVPTETKAAEQTLYDALEDAAGLIEARAYVRPNWILTNVAGAKRLRKLNGFSAVAKGDGGMAVSSASRYLCTLQEGYWNIYVDPWYRSTDTYPTYLMGYKGSSFMEAGYVYAPYVPMYRTPLFETPKTFLKQSAVMSRYAKKMLQLRFYAAVQVTAS
jgi:hypothetical protein